MNFTIPGISRKTPSLLIIVSILLMAGCQSKPVHQAYEGPVKPDNEIASLIIPESFNLLYVDRNQYQALLGGDGANVKALPGQHEFIIKFKEFWGLHGGDDHARVESNPIAITFDAKAGKTYQITFNKPTSLEEAKRYAKKPEIKVIDMESNTEITASITNNILLQKGVLGTMFGSTNAPEEHQTQSGQNTGQSGSITPMPTPATTMATTAAVAPSSPAGAEQGASGETDSKEGGRALEMLKYWWETANENQRKAFQDWVGH